MRRLIPCILALALVACTASAETRLEEAISASNKNKQEIFRGYLDADSRAFFDRIKDELRFLDDQWVFLEGAPHQLLKGALISSTEEITGSAIRVKLIGAESGLETLWMLKTGSGLFPKWEVHLISSPELFSTLRMVP